MDDDVLADSKRLQDLAYEGMLSKTRRMCTDEATPSRVLVKADGQDITKKSSNRKGRYLLNINANIAPVAAGRLGCLAQLDTRNPVMYIDLPEGRLKFFGTLMFPSNKYMVLKFTSKNVLCEDIFESMVVFSEAWWVGKKENNPDEKQLPIPQSVLEAGIKAAESGDGAQDNVAEGGESKARGKPHCEQILAGRSDDEEEDDSDDASIPGDDEVPLTQGRRMSQRSTGKRPRYAVDLSDAEDEENSEADDEGDESEDEAKMPARKRSKPAAAVERPQQREDGNGSGADDAEPGPSGAARCSAARSEGLTLQAKRTEGKKEAVASHKKPAGQKKLQASDSEDSDVIDLSSPPMQSQRPRPSRAASAKKSSLREVSSGDSQDEAEQEEDALSDPIDDDDDEDFIL